MFKKIILMTTASIYFMGIAQEAVAMDLNQDEQQAVGAAVVVNRPMSALIGNFGSFPDPLLRCSLSYLDHNDANSFAEAMHFAPLGARIHREIEECYQSRVNVIRESATLYDVTTTHTFLIDQDNKTYFNGILLDQVAINTIAANQALFNAFRQRISVIQLLQQQNIIDSPHQSLFVSVIDKVMGYFNAYQSTHANITQQLVRISNPAGPSLSALIAVGYTQHQTSEGILRAMQIGARFASVSPDFVTGYVIALCDLLGRPVEESGVPDIDDARLNQLRIIPALTDIPYAELKRVVNGTLSFIQTAFDVNPRNGWVNSPNKLSKSSYQVVCTNVLRSISRIPAEYLKDYLFVAEVIMYGDDLMSSDAKQGILAQLVGILYDSLEAVKDIVLGINHDARTANIPASSMIKYLEQTPRDGIQRNIENLMHIFSDDVGGNIKILENLNRVPYAKRQPVLETALQFLTAQPDAASRANMIQYFDQVCVDQLKHYADAARAFMIPELDECLQSMVVNELTLISHTHLDDVAGTALQFLATNNDRSASTRTRTIRFLREIKQDVVNGQYFHHYVNTWRVLNNLLKADTVADTVVDHCDAEMKTDASQILRDLQSIPHDHLDGIRQAAGHFVKIYPHLKSNKTIISALKQANFEHLYEYINAVARLVKVRGLNPIDVMEEKYGQSILRLLTNIKYDILESVVEAATQKIAECLTADKKLSFYEIEGIINACEKEEEKKRKTNRYYY